MVNIPSLPEAGERILNQGLVLRAGKYAFSIEDWKAYVSPKSPTIVNKIVLVVVEGIGPTETQLDGSVSVGKKITYMINTPAAEHPKFHDRWGNDTRAEILQLLGAAGVSVSAEGNYEESEAVGKIVLGTMTPKKEQDGSFRNFCTKWESDVAV